MNTPITEKDYPIQKRWLIKHFFGYLFFLLIYFVMIFFNENRTYVQLYFFVPFFLIHTITIILQRKTYHYKIDNQFMVLNQGILSKQQRNIPYGVIQNVFIKQTVLDRILGLSYLSIENAASSGGAGMLQPPKKFLGMRLNNSGGQNMEALGFGGNLVGIPGLLKVHAEELKNIILQKMKENPIDDSQSGL